MAASPSSAHKPHIAIFPFMSKGHTIPLLHLAHLLHHRRLASLITIFTTPLNSPFILNFLSGVEPDIIELSFPGDIPKDLPPNIESTDCLPSMLLFLPFIQAVKKLQPQFEQALKNLPTINLLISDGFLGWSGDSSAKFGIPRMVFNGMGNFAMTISHIVSINKPHKHVSSYDDPFTVTPFPHLKLTKADLNPPFDDPDPDPKGPLHEFVMEQGIATMQSHGIIVNSFSELDEIYLHYWNKNIGPKSWYVGPLCVMDAEHHQLACMQWLDARSLSNRPVLYVAFGSQAIVAPAQLQEIAVALEKSEHDFLWVIKENYYDDVLFGEFEEKVKDRGMVVHKWVDQMEILSHESVKGFMSHCGWNSVMESVVAGVPMLAWPMMAEQPLNAKFVVEEMKIGLRIRTRGKDIENEELIGRDHIEEMVRELMVGEGGKEVARNIKVLSEKARLAMECGGSSWTSLETLVSQVSSVNTVPSH
ncbi:UDP-glycosyltransferase 90A1-like [Dioscorea cayenensis subsp. rotundata]|uniref:Glycosyltransferase n=1 Tax=Dioscorea cayennensis subsp. rotundata TaxID=55577 RepID=A0AB40B971_DIOCR|nr:UDP-glycosyltransferase 90A1-like [Dioscorea cayenensis subsp. rotundata]